MRSVPTVRLFALSTCGHCKAVKKLLAELVPYELVEVDLLEGDARTEAIAQVKQYNPGCTFPTVIIGDSIIIGHREEELRQALLKAR